MYFPPFQHNLQSNWSTTATISPKNTSSTSRKQYHYTVKVINRGRKGDYKVETLKCGRFNSTEDVKDQLNKLLKCQVTDIGCTEPGHGLKGKAVVPKPLGRGRVQAHSIDSRVV